MIDGSGDRKAGTRTAHVGHQLLGRYGKTGNGVVTSPRCRPMSGCITRCMWCRTPRPGISRRAGVTPAFRTKLAIGADLAIRAQAAGFAFRPVAADSAFGDQDGFRGELAEAGLPFVMAHKHRRGTWAYGPDAHTPVDAARALAWWGPDGARRLKRTSVTRSAVVGAPTSAALADRSWPGSGRVRCALRGSLGRSGSRCVRQHRGGRQMPAPAA